MTSDREPLDHEGAQRRRHENLPFYLADFAQGLHANYDTRPVVREEWDAASGDEI